MLAGGAGESAKRMGVKLKNEITGNENYVTDVAYYKWETIEKYARAAFREAEKLGLPLISIDKSNVMPRYEFWRRIFTKISREFPTVALTHQYVDSANALLFTPAKLHAVIACGNEHGDILSDGAAAALGSMGMMCSSAINPDNRKGMFESGAGTAPTLAGYNRANPIGRILTSAMMLRHLGAIKGANAIEKAVKKALMDGWRTHDMCGPGTSYVGHILGTKEMGQLILSLI
jgi:3-isopropylmalate dehydrogenase